MKNQLHDYMGRPKRYKNIDGTGEMNIGLAAWGFALLSYLQAVLAKDSMWRNGSASLLLMAAILVPVLGFGYWGRQAIKKHITWPRTGYVAYRVGEKSWWTMNVETFVGSGIIAAGFSCLVLLARRHDAISLPRIGMLAVLVVSYAVFVFRSGTGEHRWKWLVVLFMALGLVAIALIVPGDFEELSRPVFLFVGLTWLGSGAATLYLYIQHTHSPVPEAR